MREVNILLPDISYIRPRNQSGTVHHLYDTYSQVFDNQEVRVLPIDNIQNIYLKSLVNYHKIKGNSLNVVTQGYSVLSTYAAALMKPNIEIIVHTWKVPSYSDNRVTAKINDFFLRQIIKKSILVAVASKKQERQLRDLFPYVPRCFAPVTVDSSFWNTESAKISILEKYLLQQERFVLTVGGNDRREEFGMLAAQRLKVKYVRVTKNQPIVDLVRQTERKLGLSGTTLILNGINDSDLISLYRHALVVLLPTITRTNPAGLSSLVEAMSCGGIVAAPYDLAEGYIIDRQNGLWLNSYIVNEFARKVEDMNDFCRNEVRANAQKFAQTVLNSEVVARHIRYVLEKSRHEQTV